MIESMTGYGGAEHVEDGVSYAMEVRSVNHRYLKLAIKVPEQWHAAENTIEKVIRGRIVRGSVTCTLRVRSEDDAGACPLNLAALQHYVDQIARVRLPDQVHPTIDLSVLASLPGVCRTIELDDQTRQDQLLIIEQLAERALDELIAMRREEGQALRASLVQCCGAIRERLAAVTARAPNVIDEYHERLKSRVETLMQMGKLELDNEGLMREVALYAERCDITEETTRLASHLGQFVERCDSSDRAGRTLDFLSQELLREANTIGSKSNDASIARDIVEIKGLIDRIKEQVQNVE